MSHHSINSPRLGLEVLEDRSLLSSSASLQSYLPTVLESPVVSTPRDIAVTLGPDDQKPALVDSSRSEVLLMDPAGDGYPELALELVAAARSRVPSPRREQGDEAAEYKTPAAPLSSSLPAGTAALLEGVTHFGEHAGAGAFRELFQERVKGVEAAILMANSIPVEARVASSQAAGSTMREGSQALDVFSPLDWTGGQLPVTFLQAVSSAGYSHPLRGEAPVTPAPAEHTNECASFLGNEGEGTMGESGGREETPQLSPEGGTPLAGLLPLDLKQLQQNVDAFFGHLSQLVQDRDAQQLVLRLAPWLAATTIATWKIAYRPRKRLAGAAGPALPLPGSLPLLEREDE
jgi:hypothetical protein